MSDNPTEAFKQALAETARTVAGEPELEVTFTPDPSGITGRRMRLPPVSRQLPPKEVALARGKADAHALRLRHHNSYMHTTRMPEGDMAREIYDALETARCEAIGVRDMPGMARNLDASLSEVAERSNWAGLTSTDEAPLSTACALALRKNASNRDLPAQAQMLLGLFEDRITKEAPESMDSLASAIDDQEEFARRAWRLIDDMGYGDQLGPSPDDFDQEDPDDEQDREDERDDQEDDGHDKAEGESPDDETPPEPGDEDQSADSAGSESTAVMVDAEEDEERASDRDMRADGPPPDYVPPPIPDSEASADYKVFNRDNDEEIRAEDLCEAEELSRLRGFLDQQVAPPFGRGLVQYLDPAYRGQPSYVGGIGFIRGSSQKGHSTWNTRWKIHITIVIVDCQDLGKGRCWIGAIAII